MKNFSKAALSIDVAATKKIELIAKSYNNVISLAQGIPSFQTAEHIKEAAKKAIDQNLVDKYTSGYGIEPLRGAIARKVERDNDIDVKASEVIVTHGGIEALMAIFLALLDPTNEIIVLTPDYASHLMQLRVAQRGKAPVEVPLMETDNDWVLDSARLEKAITAKTKAILICNPCNPTGKVYSQEELKEVARIAVKHNLYIITDEMYEYFVYDGKKHVSIGSFPEVADRTISVFGVSKSYAMTGWRIGYIVANNKIIDQIFKIHDSLVTCPTAVSQYAALAAITGPQDIVGEYKKAFLARRKIVIDTLAKTDKLELIIPQGTYYAFPKVRDLANDEDFVLRVMTKAKVAVIPGLAFGKGGERHLRLSFGCEEDILREGLRRLVDYLNNMG